MTYPTSVTVTQMSSIFFSGASGTFFQFPPHGQHGMRHDLSLPTRTDLRVPRSTVTLTIALIVQLVHPGHQPGPPSPGDCGQGQSAHMTTARTVVVSLLSGFLVILFAFFLLHMRHLSRVLNQTTDMYTP